MFCEKSLILISLLFLANTFVSAKTTLLQGTESNHAYQVLKVELDGTSKIALAVTQNNTPAQAGYTMMQKLGGSHAINGAFFCPKEKAYSWCEGNTTDALRISDGTLYSKRGEDIAKGRSVFGFDANGTPLPLVDNTTRTRDQSRNTRDNPALEPMKNGLMMPTLLQNGINVGKNNTEMTTDAKQGKAGNKSFICSTKTKDIVYMGYVDGLTFANFGDYLAQTFACYDAILLDNGNSKNLIYDKKQIVGPGRNLMDAFVVIEQNVIDTGLQDAISWMYAQGLTKYATAQDFMPDDTMTREQAAKFFAVFAENIFQKEKNTEPLCMFSDAGTIDSTLQESVINACLLGIMKGSGGRFFPKEKITNAQAITMLIRILEGMLPEGIPYYTPYLDRAKALGLIASLTPNEMISRGEMARLFYKAKKENVLK